MGYAFHGLAYAARVRPGVMLESRVQGVIQDQLYAGGKEAARIVLGKVIPNRLYH